MSLAQSLLNLLSLTQAPSFFLPTTRLHRLEDLKYRIQLSRSIFLTRKAEASFIRALVAETRVARSTKNAAMEYLARQQRKVQAREAYYARLFEVATENMVEAEEQAGKLIDEAEEAGVKWVGGMSLHALDFQNIHAFYELDPTETVPDITLSTD